MSVPRRLRRGAAAACAAPARSSGARSAAFDFNLLALNESGIDALMARDGADHPRLIMLNADRDFLLDNFNRLSNERIPGSFVDGGREVFYDIGVRLQGTAAGRIVTDDNMATEWER